MVETKVSFQTLQEAARQIDPRAFEDGDDKGQQQARTKAIRVMRTLAEGDFAVRRGRQ